MKKQKATILFVEDDPAQLMMYRVQAENKGYRVLTAKNEEEALREMGKKPDLVFLDMLLGNVDGTEVLRKVRENEATKNIRIVVLTNFQKQELQDKCEKLGILDYIIKSGFVPKEIVSRIAKYLKK